MTSWSSWAKPSPLAASGEIADPKVRLLMPPCGDDRFGHSGISPLAIEPETPPWGLIWLPLRPEDDLDDSEEALSTNSTSKAASIWRSKNRRRSSVKSSPL